MSHTSPVKQAPISKLGTLLYYLLPYRRRIIFSNMNQVYGESLSIQEKKHLAKAFYSHLATSLKEMLLLRFLSNDALKKRVEVQGHEHVLSVASQGKGVLLLTCHLGNWEFAPLGAMLNFDEYQGHFHFIRRTLTNKSIERLLFNRYYQAGLRVIPQKGSMQQVLEVLHDNHAIIFVLDQHASLVNRDGIAVEFFGKKAGTYRSLASLARHTELPVIPTETYRKPDGNHVLIFHPPIAFQDYPTTRETLYENTRKYNEALEQMILSHPEQWMWLHKRWKLKD